MSGVKVYG